MDPIVLADLTPLIPDFLKRVPWEVRTALIAAFLAFSGYAVIAQLGGWSLFPHASLYWGILGLLAGAPAGANVTVRKGDFAAATTDIEALANALVKAFNKAPAPVIHVHVPAGGAVISSGSGSNSSGVEPPIAPVPPEVQSALSDLSAVDPTPAPPVSPSSTDSASAPADSTSAPVVTTGPAEVPTPDPTPSTSAPGDAPAIG